MVLVEWQMLMIGFVSSMTKCIMEKLNLESVRFLVQVKALFDYGDALGIAFQIADDLLDYQGYASSTGKNVGDDFREGKLTLPVIKAVAQATKEERQFWARVIEKRNQNEGDLEHALELFEKYRTLSATRDEALVWSEKAKASMAALPEHPIRDMLTGLADYVVARLR